MKAKAMDVSASPISIDSDSVGMSPWLRRRRVIDAVAVVLSAPITIPVAAVTMCAVAVVDRAIPLIRLERIGRGGELLRLVKIRTMMLASDGSQGAAITASKDHRVTRIGSVLRSTRLDELPQLASVLTGRLALIGPRPETSVFVDMDNPLWQAALSVRPGIAGITQVIASPWEASQLNGDDPVGLYRDVAVPAKVALDAWYAHHASPKLDLQVCVSLVQMMVGNNTWTPIHKLVDAQVPAARPLLEPFRPHSEQD